MSHVGTAPSLWLGALGRLAGRAAHELKNPLNGLALNLEVVRSRSARAGIEAAALAPVRAALPRVSSSGCIPLVDALLALARPLPNPVDLRAAMPPLLVLYRAIAVAGGGSLELGYEAEQMFVSCRRQTPCVPSSPRRSTSPSEPISRSRARSSGSDADRRLAVRLVGGAGRPIATRMERARGGARHSSSAPTKTKHFSCSPRSRDAGADSNT